LEGATDVDFPPAKHAPSRFPGDERMIFGFNTDVKHGDTVYHVQTEARSTEQSLQTQVFVRGRCIGKRARPYKDLASAPGFSESQIEQLLRDQHKLVSDAAREGKAEAVLDKEATPETLAAVKELELEWLNAENVYPEGQLRLQLRVTDGGAGAGGARLTSRVSRTGQDPLYTQVVTDETGAAEMKITLEEAALAEATILVQATHDGRTATRKFQLRKMGA
jgi:hypothetical protein